MDESNHEMHIEEACLQSLENVQLKSNCISFFKTNLTQLTVLLERANLLITGDSGPMHIAAAVGDRHIRSHRPNNEWPY
ncbi:MAG TPA: glycosyltransferase family 9 protein [Ktedonobacteraceae bacterium]|nr:glycosyltransferase family 9 protein [Ktedonobacteraceae bacterium]